MPYNKRPIALILVDRKSRFRWLYLLPNREGTIVFKALQSFIQSLQVRYGKTPVEFHYNSRNKINKMLSDWLVEQGIAFNTSCPYIHEQNGLAERSIRVIADRLRATMAWSRLPSNLWSAIITGVIMLVNIIAVINRPFSPYQELLKDYD